MPIKATSTPINHTALHLASKNGHHNIVQLLIAAGCNINITTPNGSALHVAALCGKEKVVKILLKEGINLDLCDCDGRTVFDVLDDFPAHVVQRIRNIINHYDQRASVYDNNESESDDHIVVSRRSRRDEGVEYRLSLDSNRHEQQLNLNNHRYSAQSDMYGETSSPSSSMGSFGASSGFVVPIKHKTSTIPSKPPRKSLSTSPPMQHHSRPLNLMTKSFEIDLDQDIELEPERPTFKCFKSQEQLDEKKSSKSKKSNENSAPKKKHNYELMSMAKTLEPGDNNNHHHNNNNTKQSGKTSTIKTSDDEKKNGDFTYMEMSGPISIPKDYDNKIVRVMNPHRKLKKGANGMTTSAADSE